MITLNNIPLSFLYDVPNAIDHGNNIINLIKQIPPNKYKAISHTDFNLPEGFHREYTFYFLKNIYPQFKQKFLEHTGQVNMALIKMITTHGMCIQGVILLIYIF